jgi:3-methyladenine DNA glycosylase AlkD
MENIVDDVLAALIAFADETRVAFAKTSYPTKMTVLGIKNPDIKLVLREFWIQVRPWPNEEKISALLALIRSNIFECQQLAFAYLDKHKSLVLSMSEDEIDKCYFSMDNWVSTDYFAACVLGVAWRENNISTKKIKQFYISGNHWDRRIAIAATIALNQKARGGKGDADRTLEICTLAVDEKHPMVIKALSWALRQLVSVDKNKLEGFIEAYRDRLPKLVLREVDKKMTTGKKNG